jgi:polyribonucleotide nucleotidyltransferase
LYLCTRFRLYSLFIDVIQINPVLLPSLIGIGGSHIRNIELKTNSELHVDSENHTVSIFSRSPGDMKQAIIMVNSLAGDIISGHEYNVIITKITDMGIHVQLEEHPGREGFIHITEMFEEPKAHKIEDIYKVNDTLRAKAMGYDNRGRLLMTLREDELISRSGLLYTYINPLTETDSYSPKDVRFTAIKKLLDKSVKK